MSEADDSKPKSKRSATPAPLTQPSPPDQPGVSPVPQAVAQAAVKIMRKCKYGLGYKPDTHDKTKDQTIRHLLGALNGVTPPEVSNLEQYIYPYGVKDQGQSSECLAFAIARAITIGCAFRGIPLKEWPSTTSIYTVARAADRAAQGGTPSSMPLTDGGSIPLLAVQGINDWGVCADSQWPFDPNDLSHINDEPTLDKLEDASQFKVPGYYRIGSSGTQRLQDVKQALAAGYPVIGGFIVDQAFEAYSGGVVRATGTPVAIDAPDMSQALGGHGLCLLGYQTNPDGSVYVRGCNSWSTTWGDQGLFWATAEWLQDPSVMDLLVLTFDPSHHAIAA